jgi:uncharacterized protein (DUF1501 family)
MQARNRLDHVHATGISRREWLQVGYSGLLGIGLSALPATAKDTGPRASRKPRSMILIFLPGAPSHLDTFDPKPEAPAEIRGEFRTIATKIPGVAFCEHLPRLAARADRYALVRSLAHRQSNHLNAMHYVLTGSPQPGASGSDKSASRSDWPNYASVRDYCRPRKDGISQGVNVPTLTSPTIAWPGQHAGFLGARHDPWQITRDPGALDFHVDNLALDAGINIERLNDRQDLLSQVNRQQAHLAKQAQVRDLTIQQQQAFSVLTARRFADAFDLNREPLSVRERYGRHSFGQTLLLARRLVQAGMAVVQANMGRDNTWDSHGQVFHNLKNKLLPPLDQAVAALLDDLETSGLLEETLVVLLGEFGRSPKLNHGDIKQAGRDHWPDCFTGLFAGAGVRGGQVIGKSDKIGAYPTTDPYSPDDLGATIYRVLGVDAASELRDRQGRPVQLNRGSVIQSLFTGR